MITVPREVCRDLDLALTREWLVTNGRGSYASSTITGARTRRYHGLLVAALKPPLGRTLLLAKIDEEVEVAGQTYRLGTNEYQGGTVEPNGFLYLQQIQVEGMYPTFYYEAASFKLRKTIWMEHDRDTTYIRYTLDPQSTPITLTMLFFCACRDFHSLTKGASDAGFAVEPRENGFALSGIAGGRRLSIFVIPGAIFTPLGLWYWRFQLRGEVERGLDSVEDLYTPGLLRAQVEPGQGLDVVVTLEEDAEPNLEPDKSWDRAASRTLYLGATCPDEFERQLLVASDQFLVKRPGVKAPDRHGVTEAKAESTIIAGYHWFGEWGRDTMISLEGLTLTTGRFAAARDLLTTYARFVSDGMLPNRFPDSGGKPDYNTVDATLWYFHALDRYLALSGERQLLGELFPVLRDIINWHVKGTRFGIHMDRADGLLFAGEAGVQLTWMDAKVGDWVVTPRTGKPVEINALWYNALCLMREWSKELDETDPTYARLASQSGASFERFWYEPGGYLYDVIDGPGGNDFSLRPNQLFALSLPNTPVPLPHAKSVLDAVSRELLTPYGLRSLTPRHPDYRGRFKGDQAVRDAAYHNGTVWPWLLGAYVDSHRRVYPDADTRLGLFEPLKAHLAEGGLGTISECFEGDSPHRPVGCIAQAWSVAEILRSYRATNGERQPADSK